MTRKRVSRKYEHLQTVPIDWVKDPQAPVYPSQSKSINHTAFKATVESPSLHQVMDKLRAIEALVYRQANVARVAVVLPPPPRPWYSRLWRLLFAPWAADG